MSDVQIKEMAETWQLPESIDVVAPVDGFILARNIAVGPHFDRSVEFQRIVDLSQVWILVRYLGQQCRILPPRCLGPDQSAGSG